MEPYFEYLPKPHTEHGMPHILSVGCDAVVRVIGTKVFDAAMPDTFQGRRRELSVNKGGTTSKLPSSFAGRGFFMHRGA